MPDRAVRQACYHRIRDHMKQSLKEYYRLFPDRADDERSRDAIEYSVRGLEGVLKILDDYVITMRPKVR